MRFLGIDWHIGGEDPLNEKLERYRELSQNWETETYEEWCDSPIERQRLYVELVEEKVIVYDEPEKPGFFGRLFGGK